MVNNKSWVDPTALYLTKGDCCVAEGEHFATHVIDIALDETVDLVVIADGRGAWPFVHPLHLLQCKFWVVATGALPFRCPTRRRRRARTRRARPSIRPRGAALSDTFPIRTGYWYVLRVHAANAGMWHLLPPRVPHVLGLQVVLNVGKQQPAPPDSYFEGIEQFPGECSALMSDSGGGSSETQDDGAAGGGVDAVAAYVMSMNVSAREKSDLLSELGFGGNRR